MNEQLVAWDQNVRTLPIEVNVKCGQRLRVRCEHDDKMVRIGLPEIHPEMVAGTIGHREVLPPPPGQPPQGPTA